jgi:hypothetical protein
MNRRVRGLPLLTAALAVCLGARAGAQSLPPAPVPVAQPSAAELAPLTPPPPPVRVAQPSAAELSPLTPPPPPPVYHDPLPSHDTLLDVPAAAPGWFGALEIGVLKPHVKNRLSADVSFDGMGTDTVHLPTATLEWAAAPSFELGYRLADGCGELVVSYRNLSTNANADLPNYDVLGDGVLHSRLDVNTVDFDYGGPVLTLGPRVDVGWRVGVRFADVFFDSHAVGLFMAQHTSNQFTGAGPHASLDLWYRLGVPGLGLFARLQGALPIGHIHQGYSESFAFDDGSVIGAGTSHSATQAVPTIDAQVGVGWAPPGTRLRFVVGYEYEQWWSLGSVGSSRAELFDQGAFFRAEFGF